MGYLGLRGWLLVSGVLLFAAGGALGFLASTFLGSDVYRDDDESGPKPDAADIVHVTNARVYDLLGLQESQRAQAERTLGTYFQKQKRLWDELESLGQKVEEDLLALLDEGQREKMHDIVRRIRINDVAERVTKRLSFWKREMKLTAQQEDAIYPILLSEQLAKDEVLANLRGRSARGEKVDRKETQGAFAKIDEERKEKLRPILTAEQVQKLAEMEKRRRIWGESKNRERPQMKESAKTGERPPETPAGPDRKEPAPPEKGPVEGKPR